MEGVVNNNGIESSITFNGLLMLLLLFKEGKPVFFVGRNIQRRVTTELRPDFSFYDLPRPRHSHATCSTARPANCLLALPSAPHAN